MDQCIPAFGNERGKLSSLARNLGGFLEISLTFIDVRDGLLIPERVADVWCERACSAR